MPVRKKVTANPLVTQFAAQEPNVQANIIEWADFTQDDWAKEFLADIANGDLDEHLASIVVAANHRMSSVIVGDNKEEDAAARLSGMRLAAQIVRELALTEQVENIRRLKGGKTIDKSFDKVLGVTASNWSSIVDEHGKQYRDQLHMKSVAARIEHDKIQVDTAKRRAKAALADAKEKDTVDMSGRKGPHKKKVPASTPVGMKERTIMAKSVKVGDVYMADGKSPASNRITAVEKIGTASVKFTMKSGVITKRATSTVTVNR